MKWIYLTSQRSLKMFKGQEPLYAIFVGGNMEQEVLKFIWTYRIDNNFETLFAIVILNRFKRFPVVFAGDLHAQKNSQRNIVYPGSPMTTSFHRSKVNTGVLVILDDLHCTLSGKMSTRQNNNKNCRNIQRSTSRISKICFSLFSKFFYSKELKLCMAHFLPSFAPPPH